MANTGSGQGSSLRLRVASWGDPDIQLNGLHEPRMGFQAEDLSRGRQPPHLNLTPSSDLQQLQQDATPEASGSNPYRQSIDSDGGGEGSSRRHNLRPRAGLHSLAAASAMDPEDREFDDDTDYDDGAADSQDGSRRGKKKVGRPIAYKGDPNSPHLTEAERRRMKRRIANRESARRVRVKRQEFLEDLQIKIAAVQAQNQELQACVSEIERHKATMTHQMFTLREKWTEATEENVKLRDEVASLRQHLQEQQTEIGQLDQPASHAPTAAGKTQTAPQANRVRRPIPTNLSFSPAGSLGLQNSGSAFDLPSLLQLTSAPSRELPSLSDGKMQRQSSVQPPPDVGRLPDIQPLTGLQQLNTLSAAKSSQGRQDNGELNRGTSARRLSNTAVELADPSYTVVAGTPGEPSSARPQGHA